MKATGKNSKRNLQDKGEKKKKRKEKVKKTLSKIAKGVLPSAAGLAMGALIGPASGPLCSFITSQLLKLNISIGADKVAEIAEELVSTTAEESADAILTRKIKEEASIDGKQIKTLLKNQTNEISELNNKIKLAVQSSLRPALDGIKEGMSFIRKFPSETVEILAETQNGKFQELSEKFSHYLDSNFDEIKLQLKETERLLGLKIDSITSQLSILFEVLMSTSFKKLDKNSAIALYKEQFSSEIKSSRWDSPYNPDLYVNRESAEECIWKFISDITKLYDEPAYIFTLLAGIGVGKTWLMAHIADKLIQSGHPVLFFTLKSGGVSRINRVLGVNSAHEAYNIICNIAAAVKKPIFLFMDGLDEMMSEAPSSIIDWAIDLRNNMGGYNIGIFISSRQYDWESNQSIDELISKNSGVFYQIDEQDGTSILLTKFSEKEMNKAANNYGISEKLRKFPKLVEYAKYPFILRLFGEYCKDNKKRLPNPDEIDEFMKIFYTHEKNSMSKTIMGRMGIRGRLLGKTKKILSCCENNSLILNEIACSEKLISQIDIDYVVSCGLFIREFGFDEYTQVNPIYNNFVRELARRYKIKFIEDQKTKTNYDFAREKVVFFLRLDEFKDALSEIEKEKKKADNVHDSETWKKLQVLSENLDYYINDYNLIIQFEIDNSVEKNIESWKKLANWCRTSELVAVYSHVKEKELELVSRNIDNLISKQNFYEAIIQLKYLRVYSKNGIFPERLNSLNKKIGVCENIIHFYKIEEDCVRLINVQDFYLASEKLNEIKKISLNAIHDLFNLDLESNIQILEDKLNFEQEKIWKEFEKITYNAKSYFEKGDYKKSIKLFKITKNICDEQGWNDGAQNAERMIAECEKNIEGQNKQSKKNELKRMLSEAECLLAQNENGNNCLHFDEVNCKKALSLYSSAFFYGKNNQILGDDQNKFLLQKIDECKLLVKYGKLEEYNGVLLNGLDCLVLKEFHAIIGENIPVVPEAKWDLFGFAYKDHSITGLGLSKKGIKYIPENIGYLKSLKFLDLNGNKFYSLPDCMENLKDLESLHIGWNKIFDFPKVIIKMTWLKALTIAGNDLKINSIPDTIVNLKSLKFLHSYKINLQSFPDVITKMKCLEILDLGGNNLSNIPKSIGNLQKLKQLSLYNNNLTELPENIGNLKNLEKLWIYNNSITALPKTITNLTSLIRLRLDNNQFTLLPKYIEDWILNLKRKGCKITGFEEWKSKEQNRNKIEGNNKKIELSKPKKYNGVLLSGLDWAVLNELQDIIGEKIPAVSNISWNTFGFTHEDQSVTNLSLYKKGLTSLPESIGKLTTLKKLYLNKNRLISLPGSIGCLKKLKILSLSHNQLMNLPESFGNLISLIYLDLKMNQLTNLPESIGNLTELNYLYFESNRLSSLPESIGNLSSLKELKLIMNKLSSLPESIGNLKSLKELFLSGNDLATLPLSIGDLKALETLRIDNNQLYTLPESIGNVKNLKSLSLIFNKLSSLPESIKKWIKKLEDQGCSIAV